MVLYFKALALSAIRYAQVTASDDVSCEFHGIGRKWHYSSRYG